MDERPYDTEDVLQLLLASYPDLLPGDQITPENPRRWLLVAREMGVPGDVDETDRWSLDHLFLDQDGRPTFVECKRASDTRSRREVVAQMLDYAANGIVHWGIDRLRQAAAETAQRRGKAIDTEIRMLLNTEDDAAVETFWKQVEENLRTGRVRLIFVADSIPKELRRLVEFLNEKMADVEVLAVEVKQFLGSSQKALVPRVIGLTEAARERKPPPRNRGLTNRETMLASCTPDAARVFAQLLDQAAAQGYTLYWGEVGFSIRVPIGGRLTSIVYGYPPDRFEFYFGNLQIPEDAQRALRAELLALGTFKAAGGKTLRTSLQGDVLKQIDHVVDFILHKLDELAQAPPST
jgi:hypothetical protein